MSETTVVDSGRYAQCVVIGVLIAVVISGCASTPKHDSKQPIEYASGLSTGMSLAAVTSLMGAPATSDVAGQIKEWHYCRTGDIGTDVVRMVAIFFVDDYLLETVKYSVTLAEVGGITGPCENFIKMGGYREPIRVTSIRRGLFTPPASDRTEGDLFTPPASGRAEGIKEEDPDLMWGNGTAFIVHPDGLLLTAHHVIDQGTSITVSCNGQPAVPAAVTSSSPEVDLAILEADGDLGTTSFLRLSQQHVPSLGDIVFTVGYPLPGGLGTDPKYTNGTVTALSGWGSNANFLQISVPIQPGNSGGPLVNEDGEVVGVVVSSADAPWYATHEGFIPQNINWAVKSVFASTLFTPPSASVTSANDPEGIIEVATEATCLVWVAKPAQ